MATIAKIFRIHAEGLQVNELANLLQNALDTVKTDDLIKLLRAVKKNKDIVKTAIKFL